MIRRRLVATLVAAVLGAVLVAVPATAQPGTSGTPEQYAATSSGNAFKLSIAGNDLTFGSNNASIDSTPKAHADGQGALIVSTSVGGSKADSPAGGATVDQGTKAAPVCGPLTLPAGLPALGLATACSYSHASTANGTPDAAAYGGSVDTLSVDTASLLGVGKPLGQLGSAVTGALTNILGQLPLPGGTGDSLSTLLNQLLTGQGAQVLSAQIGISTSSTAVTSDAITATSNSTGASLCIGAVVPGVCLITVTVGTAGATATCTRSNHVAKPSINPAVLDIQLLPAALPQLYALPGVGTVLQTLFGQSGSLEVAPNAKVIDLSPLAIITPSSGTTSTTSSGASAAAASLQVDVLPGAVSGKPLLTLALSQAQAAVSCKAAVPGTAPTTSTTQPAAKKLAFTGDTPWRPVLGAVFLVLAAGGLEVIRRARRAQRRSGA
jgi:hypothetical protein